VPKSIVIQSWRGAESLAAAAKQGYHGLLSEGYYLDLGWSAARHYAVDPSSGPAAALTPEQKKLILGGEACMWSEYVDAENIDSRLWPRGAAIAERLWSPQETTDPNSMYLRLDSESQRLEWLGLAHRSYQSKMLQRMAGTASLDESAALRTLTEALETVKDYTREGTAKTEATSRTALNRVVDAAAPESDAARRFSDAVDQFLAAACKDGAKAGELRAQLTLWAGNDARLKPLEQRSSLVMEAAPASAALSQAAGLALNALERIRQGSVLPDGDKKLQLDALNSAEEQAHKSQLTLPARLAFQKLIEAPCATSLSSPPEGKRE